MARYKFYIVLYCICRGHRRYFTSVAVAIFVHVVTNSVLFRKMFFSTVRAFGSDLVLDV